MNRLILVLFAASIGCRELPDADAVAMVRNYNERVIEAFRTADARLIDPVTGPTDGKRLTGLIGVKKDMGLTLDAKLLDLKVLRVEQRRGEVVVLTEERWHYRDRRIGTGEQVGAPSDDHYFMRYYLRKPEGRWVVDEIAFDREPDVGRSHAPNTVPVEAGHNFTTVTPAQFPPATGAPGNGKRTAP